MKLLVFLSILLSLPAKASVRSWFKSFCERHLIANDPYPFAEESSLQLINFYRETGSTEVEKELYFRLRSGMLSPEEIAAFLEARRQREG